MVEFGELTPDGYTHKRTIEQSVIRACPFFIFMPDHYREDGTCKCDDPHEREMMISELDYTEEDFKNIPLMSDPENMDILYHGDGEERIEQ
jgi:hypothetical protein